jgi:tetratricopeptide (TPR) repeat protein
MFKRFVPDRHCGFFYRNTLMEQTQPAHSGPLDHIMFISIPEESKREINGFVLDPAILIPVEFPQNGQEFDIEELSWEMIISAMLKIFAYNRTHEDIPYYRSFINAVQPNLVTELTKTGIIKAEAKEYALAEEIFLALCHLAPEEATTFLNLAFVYEEQADGYKEAGEFTTSDYYADKALNIYQEALEVHPESTDVHFYLGYFYLKQNDLSKAQEYFELFLGLAFDDERSEQVQLVVDSIRNQTQDDNLFARSFELIRNGQEREALDVITEFISRHADIWNAWFLKGWAHRRLAEYSEGKKALERCLQLERGNTDTYNEIAICSMELGDMDDAKRYLTTALSLEPDNVKIISNLGVLSLKMNDSDQAKTYFSVAAELDPHEPVIQQFLSELD